MPNQPETNPTTHGRTPNRPDQDLPRGQTATAQSPEGEQSGCCGEADGVEDENTGSTLGAGIQKQNEKQRGERSVGNESQGRDKSNDRDKNARERQTTGAPVSGGTEERE